MIKYRIIIISFYFLIGTDQQLILCYISHNEYLLPEGILMQPGIAQGDLARKTLIQRSYVSKLLTSLENDKYITGEHYIINV